MQLAERLEGGSRDAQAEVLAAFVEAVRPFGDLDGGVVEPSLFQSVSQRILIALADPAKVTDDIGASMLEDLPFMREIEEPDGLGWFACGAVVEVIYAAWFLQGRPRSVEYAYTRMADLLDAADDDLGTSLHDLLVSAVEDALSGPGEGAWSPLIQECAQAARRLKEAASA